MRLSEVLSKPISKEYFQVEGFLGNRRLGMSKPKKISVGKIALNFYCKNCADYRTFCSSDDLFCIGVNEKMVSLDCVLKCPLCLSSVQVWYLIESEDEIFSTSPSIRVVKRSEKLSNEVLLKKDSIQSFSDYLERAQRAYIDGLGAGSVVYLRKIYERIIIQSADVLKLNIYRPNGSRKPFKDLLETVDLRLGIIPREYSDNSYKLFGELSEIIHGDSDEEKSLEKYEALRRLIIGIIENVKNNKELMEAIGQLGWNRGELNIEN